MHRCVVSWRWMWLGVACLSILGNMWLLFVSSFNFPIGDDYHVILRFLNDWFGASDLQAKVHLLFATHNEHVPFLGRLLLLSLVYATGAIYFPLLSFLGFFFLALAVYALYVLAMLDDKCSGNGSDSFLCLAIICFLLIQPQFAEAIAWPTVAITVVPAFALALLSFVYGSVKQMPLVGFVLAVLSSLSAANGIPALFFYGISQRARPWVCVASLLSSVLMLCLVSQSWVGRNWVTGGSVSDRQFHLYGILSYLLSSLGSGWAFGRPECAIIAGVVLLALSGVIVVRDRCRSAWTWALMTIISVATFQAASRYHLGLDSSFETSRYRIVSLLLSALVLSVIQQRIWIASTYRGRRSYYAIVLLALGNSIASHSLFWDEYRFWGAIQEEGLFRWSFAREATSYASKEDSTSVVTVAQHLGYFTPRDLEREQYQVREVSDISRDRKSSSQLISHLDIIGESEGVLLLRGDVFLWNSVPCDKIVIIAKSDRQSSPVFFETRPRSRVDVYRFHEKHFPWIVPRDTGILALIPSRYRSGLKVACFQRGILYGSSESGVARNFFK